MRSRVIPGSSVTMERRDAVSRLKIVDLPTLGRPTITTEGSFSVIFPATEDTTNLKREARSPLVYPTGHGNRSSAPPVATFDQCGYCELRSSRSKATPKRRLTLLRTKART